MITRIISRAIATIIIETVEDFFGVSGVSVLDVQVPSVQHNPLDETGRDTPEQNCDFKQTSPARSAQVVSERIEVTGVMSSSISKRILSSVRDFSESAWIPPSNSPEVSALIENITSASSPGDKSDIKVVSKIIRSVISSDTSRFISPVDSSPLLIMPRVIFLVSPVFRVSSIVFAENCSFEDLGVTSGSIVGSSSGVGSGIGSANSVRIT